MKPHTSDDLSSLTVAELIAELTRIEDRLVGRRAAVNYRASPEIARLERQIRSIRGELNHRADQP